MMYLLIDEYDGKKARLSRREKPNDYKQKESCMIEAAEGARKRGTTES
jgi:hypothetical protein